MVVIGQPPEVEEPCLNCLDCVAVCPARLLPNHLFHFARAGLDDRLATYRVADCTGCGNCTEVCPAGLPLVQVIGEAREKQAGIDPGCFRQQGQLAQPRPPEGSSDDQTA